MCVNRVVGQRGSLARRCRVRGGLVGQERGGRTQETTLLECLGGGVGCGEASSIIIVFYLSVL